MASCFMQTMEDEIVAVMDGQRGGERVDREAEERWRAALIAFLGVGMASPPAAALLVEALAGARRAVAARQPAACAF